MHLEHIGVTFHRNDAGELDLRAFGGASMNRTAYVADITGQAILHVLYEQLMKHSATVERFEEWFVTSLIIDDDGSCVGVVARDIRSGRMETFAAKNVILASGGAGQCFKPTTNALICTADGITQAYRAGAPLMDMEMIQYHPTTLAENGFLITEGARGEGAHLLNSEGERFMAKTAPNKMELASRDVVSRAEQIEINEGRGVGPDRQGIYLDITVVPRKRTLEALREIVNIGKDFAGVDITREPIIIQPGPALHHGRRQDRQGRSHVDPRALRGRRGGLRLRSRRQPARRQLAARHADLRPPLRRARGGPRALARDAVGLRRAAAPRHRDDRADHRAPARRAAHLRDQGRSSARR